tara:strand:+ start:53 stop:484 length:432 start_codon:yes stop_codon:yes gene_type:complete
MKLLISEVLQKVHSAKTKAQKVKILQDNNTNALRSILIANFDESVQSLLPDGEVPYEKNDAPLGTEHTVLEQEYRKLYLFFKGGSTIKQSQRENLFIQMLEGLSVEEAELLILVKDKALNKKYRVTRACVENAFPSIEWGGRS